VEELRVHNAIRIVQRARLQDGLAWMLAGTDESRALGARGRDVFEREAGATERALEALIAVLEARSAASVGTGARA
jgi:3-deoxy-D-manno-octulosonic-acid transferase